MMFFKILVVVAIGLFLSTDARFRPQFDVSSAFGGPANSLPPNGTRSSRHDGAQPQHHAGIPTQQQELSRLDSKESSSDATYTWTRQLKDGNIVKESAETKGGNLVELRSTDGRLEELGYTRAIILYDFSQLYPVVAITPYHELVCFLTTTSLTYQEALPILKGSLNVSDQVIALDGTFLPFTDFRAEEFYQINQVFVDFCKGKQLIGATRKDLEGVPPFYGPTQELKVVTLDSITTIKVRLSSTSSTTIKPNYDSQGSG